MNKKKKNRIKKTLLVFVLMFSLIVPICVNAAITSTYKDKNREDLIGEAMVGRYRFNYIGNTNYNQYWLADSDNKFTVPAYSSDTTNNVNNTRKTAAAKALGLKKGGSGKDKNDPDPSKITNSTSGKLVASSGANKIVKAYLVWQTRSSSTAGIALVAPDNTAKKVKPAATYVDERKCKDWTKESLHCSYADVTDNVIEKGYGNWSVCNIPVWSKDGVNGGESVASWELIVIEEGVNFPVRSLMLRMASVFNQNTDLDAVDIPETLTNGNGLKTATDTGSNVITGQVLYMASVSSTTSKTLSASVYFGGSKPSDTSKIKKIDKSSQGGMKKDDALVGTASTCIRGDLDDFKAQTTKNGEITRFGFNQQKATLSLNSEAWMSFFLFGLAVDVAQPEVTSSQQTTVNSSTSVTVTGRADNNSTQAKTGYYDGTLTVTLDSALTATNATMTVYNKYKPEETTVINGVSSGNIVIFNGESVRGKAKGSYLTYSIECSVDTSQGKTEFNNSHELTGTLFSRDYSTGVDVFLTSAASKGTPMYSVTLVPADNIDTVSATDLTASKATVTKDYIYGTPVSITATPNSDSEFTKWVDDAGTEITNNPYSFTVPNKNVTYTAYGKKVYYKVTLHEGTGIESVEGDGTYTKGMTVTINAEVKEGYHWLNWTGTYNTDSMNYSFTMPGNDVEMTANAEANPYTIHFDPNGGTGHIDDIQTTYDTDVTLPDATDVYKKYTLDGVNVTDDVVSGIIPEDLIIRSAGNDETGTEEFTAETPETAETEDETRTSKEVGETAKTGEALEGRMEIPDSTEILEDSTEQTELENSDTENTEAGEAAEDVAEGQETTETAEDVTEDTENEEMSEDGDDEDDELESEEDTKAAHSLKKAYPSVFLGWALYDDKDKLTPTWKAGDVVRNLTAENGGEITLYAVWDDCPWIEAHDLYYTLAQAQSGFITEEEILSHAAATDREDGSPILPGTNPAVNNPAVNTSFSIPDYLSTEFTNMTHDAAVSENLTVVDSVGNTYWKQIMVYVVDTTPREVKPEGTTRFISEKYFNADYEHGGLENNSIWKTNPEYRAVLQEAFDNLKNDTPEQTYYFTHETILEMKQYIQDYGVGNTKEPDALQNFYDIFMEPNKIE